MPLPVDGAAPICPPAFACAALPNRRPRPRSGPLLPTAPPRIRAPRRRRCQPRGPSSQRKRSVAGSSWSEAATGGFDGGVLRPGSGQVVAGSGDAVWDGTVRCGGGGAADVRDGGVAVALLRISAGGCLRRGSWEEMRAKGCWRVGRGQRRRRGPPPYRHRLRGRPGEGVRRQKRRVARVPQALKRPYAVSGADGEIFVVGSVLEVGVGMVVAEVAGEAEGEKERLRIEWEVVTGPPAFADLVPCTQVLYG